MKAGALVAVNLVVTIAVVGAAQMFAGGGKAHDPRTLQENRSTPVDTDLQDRVDALTAREEANSSAIGLQGADLARLRQEQDDRLSALEDRLAALETRVEEGAGAAAVNTAPETKPGPGSAKKAADKFTKQVSDAIRNQIKDEFKRYYDLVNNPTPEAEEQRRMQLAMGARMFGSQAGLDKEEMRQLETIFTDVDRQVRDDLRPLLLGKEDPKDLDYDALRTATTKAFDEQNRRFDESFSKDKAEKLSKGMEPFRGMFETALDDLQKQSAAKPTE